MTSDLWSKADRRWQEDEAFRALVHVPRTEQAQNDADNRADAERAGEFTPQPDSHRGGPGWIPSRDEWDGDGR